MRPEQLSEELRNSDNRFLSKRRGVLGLALTAAGAMGLISLYQMGIIKRIPEPRFPKLDAEKVNGSAEAYSLLSTPDAVLGFASYAATMTLAAMGEAGRAKTHPWIPLAMAGKVVFDAAQASKLTVDQAVKYKAFCVWCLLAAGATLAMVPLVVPEARAALRQLRNS